MPKTRKFRKKKRRQNKRTRTRKLIGGASWFETAIKEATGKTLEEWGWTKYPKHNDAGHFYYKTTKDDKNPGQHPHMHVWASAGGYPGGQYGQLQAAASTPADVIKHLRLWLDKAVEDYSGRVDQTILQEMLNAAIRLQAEAAVAEAQQHVQNVLTTLELYPAIKDMTNCGTCALALWPPGDDDNGALTSPELRIPCEFTAVGLPAVRARLLKKFKGAGGRGGGGQISVYKLAQQAAREAAAQKSARRRGRSTGEDRGSG